MQIYPYIAVAIYLLLNHDFLVLVDYLKKDFKKRNKKNKSYSIRAYAKFLGLDQSVLAKILSGKRDLTFKLAKKIVEAINENQAVKDMLLLSYIDDKKFRVEEDYFVPNEAESAELMSKWEYYTVLSYIEITPNSTAKKIAADIGTTELTVKQILNNLIRLGIIKDNKGLLETTGKVLTAPPSFNLNSLVKVQCENMHKAISRFENGPRQDQDYSGMTIAISSKKVHQAAEMIKTFRRSLAEFLSDPKEKPDSIYRLNIQFFPFYIKK
jgi:uncharacterized protein (TIGR02147 family)